MAYIDALLDLGSLAKSGADKDYNTTCVDVGTITRELGTGEPLAVLITVTTSAAIVGSLQFHLEDDDNLTFGTGTAPVVQSSSRVFGAADDALLAAGKQVILDFPAALDSVQQYVGVSCSGTNAGDTVTFEAAIMPKSQAVSTLKTYAKAAGAVIASH